jgi:hypothetical protein
VADYIDALRKQHIENVLKAMIFEALQRNDLKFTRPYALLSLMSLGERSDPDEIFEQAEQEGYEGTEEGIKAGLKALRASGLVLKDGGKFKLNPWFEDELSDFATELRQAIGFAKA